MQMLPKIKNEVLMRVRWGLNRWFLALQSGGDAAKSGRAALRRCTSWCDHKDHDLAEEEEEEG